jgi:FKBP-type peptidyl-prolyl cis-trans isomerase FkpA
MTGKMTRVLGLGKGLLLAIAILMMVACNNEPTAPTQSTTVTSTEPYSQTDLTVGTGALAGFGNRVAVAYTGWLDDTSRPEHKGALFDTSLSFAFHIGIGQVIKGWEQGIPGMRVGGQRRLIIPPELAYGTAGSGLNIPPNATLVFDITLLAVQ